MASEAIVVKGKPFDELLKDAKFIIALSNLEIKRGTMDKILDSDEHREKFFADILWAQPPPGKFTYKQWMAARKYFGLRLPYYEFVHLIRQANGMTNLLNNYRYLFFSDPTKNKLALYKRANINDNTPQIIYMYDEHAPNVTLDDIYNKIAANAPKPHVSADAAEAGAAAAAPAAAAPAPAAAPEYDLFTDSDADSDADAGFVYSHPEYMAYLKEDRKQSGKGLMGPSCNQFTSALTQQFNKYQDVSKLANDKSQKRFTIL